MINLLTLSGIPRKNVPFLFVNIVESNTTGSILKPTSHLLLQVRQRLAAMSKKDDEDGKKGKKNLNGDAGSQSNSQPGNPTLDKDDGRLFQDCYTLHMETASFKVI